MMTNNGGHYQRPSNGTITALNTSTTSSSSQDHTSKLNNGSKSGPVSPRSPGIITKKIISTFEIDTEANDMHLPSTNSSPSSSVRSPSQLTSSFKKRYAVSAVKSFRHKAIHHIQSQWAILLAGQILSFLMACSGAAQATLSFDCDLSAPTLSLFLFYFCLAFCLVPMCRENTIRKRTQQIQIDLHREYETASQARNVNSPSHNNNNTQQSSKQNNSIRNSPSRENSSSSTTTTASTEIKKSYPFMFGLLTLTTPAYVYFFMAILDVYANYFTVLAFKYTTITSVTLLDALAIPSAMVLSRAFLKREYSKVHLAGALLCMVGVVLNVLQDYEDDKTKTTTGNEADIPDPMDVDFPYKVKGDIMATLGGILFGASSVVGEVAVRDLGGPNEYVGMLGFFCAIICFFQTIVLEMDDVAAFLGRKVASNDSCTAGTSRILLVAFVIISVINYLGRAWFLQVSEAAFLNLSLLTGDMWSVLFSVFAEKIAPHAFFYVALTITLSGVFVYEMAPSPVHENDTSSSIIINHQNSMSRIAQESDDDDDELGILNEVDFENDDDHDDDDDEELVENEDDDRDHGIDNTKNDSLILT